MHGWDATDDAQGVGTATQRKGGFAGGIPEPTAQATSATQICCGEAAVPGAGAVAGSCCGEVTASVAGPSGSTAPATGGCCGEPSGAGAGCCN